MRSPQSGLIEVSQEYDSGFGSCSPFADSNLLMPVYERSRGGIGPYWLRSVVKSSKSSRVSAKNRETGTVFYAQV